VSTSFFRFVTIHAFDRRTDRQTYGQKGLGKYPALRYMQSYGNEQSYYAIIWSYVIVAVQMLSVGLSQI